ncbi:MAG TPA: hypothetical protein VME18_12650, partial [Acidobacteriaceae bacterium]|nr:hypothetical protein [Acidobacteriaceae bacterium]
RAFQLTTYCDDSETFLETRKRESRKTITSRDSMGFSRAHGQVVHYSGFIDFAIDALHCDENPGTVAGAEFRE